MYESFYGLSRRPFAATPDPDCFVPVETIQHALTELLLCVHTGQGVGVLTAPAGTGKTLLCRRIEHELADAFQTVVIPSANFPTRRSLLQAILYELGHPYIRMAEQELRLELVTAVRAARSRNQGVAILLDEAHLLSDRLLEEVRAITNLIEDGEPLVHVILSGQLALEERLASPALDALNQRIGCQVLLESLTKLQSAEYLRSRLEWAGGSLDAIFTREAVQLICHCADGLPRCLNHLADHSLLLGYVNEENPVTADTVREALVDLKQLPLHWNDPVAVLSPLEQLSAQVRSEPVGVQDAAAFEPDEDRAIEDDPAEMASVEFGSTDEFAAIEVGAGDEAIVATPSPVMADVTSGEVDTAPAEAVAEIVPASRDVFEEELVSDPYATLDARGPFAGGAVRQDIWDHADRTASLDHAPAVDDVPSSFNDDFDCEEPESTRYDDAFDEVLPLLQESMEPEDEPFGISAGPPFLLPAGREPAAWEAPLADPSAGLTADDEPLEEQIGAAVLDACLEVQRAIADGLDDHPLGMEPENDANDGGAAEEAVSYTRSFDIVEPDHRVTDTTTNRTPDPLRRHRQYERLFSALRRRRGA